MKIKEFSILLLTVFIYFAFLQCSVSAQEYSYSAKVYPVSQRYAAKPNFKLIESRLTIQNTGEDALFNVASSFEKDFLNVNFLYLDKDQKWSPVTKPLLIKSKRSSIVMLQIKPKNELEERDYLVGTDITILPAYTPLTSSKNIQIQPKIKTKTVISVTENGYTNIKAKIAFFTNLGGAFILSDNSPKIVLLVQNLDKYSLDVNGTIEIKTGDKTKIVDLSQITIEANNQAYLTNNQNNDYIGFGEKLKPGKYELNARIRTGHSSEPTVFATYVLWVFPHTLLYSLVAALIVLLIILFFYHFINFKHGF